VRNLGTQVSRFLYDKGWRAPHIAETWRAYASLTESENRDAFVRTLRAVIDARGQSVSARDRLYLAAGLPTLIVWGDADDIIPATHAYEAHEAIADSRLEIFPGAGHFVHVEQPGRFAEVLIDFIETTKPGSVGLERYREILLAHSRKSA
jgi:pimeloyl-ACP methyl ester carboxylesterase